MDTSAFIIVVTCFFSTLTGTATLKPASGMTCTSQIPTIQLAQGEQGSCCSVADDTSTCIASTLQIPRNLKRVTLKWNATLRARMRHDFKGIRLLVWKNEIAPCPDTCYTITYPQDEIFWHWNGTISFNLNCIIHLENIGYGVDVLPIIKSSITPTEELHCDDLFEVLNTTALPDRIQSPFRGPPSNLPRQITSGRVNTPSLSSSGHTANDTQLSTSIGVALVILTVVVSFSFVTVFVWCLVRAPRGNVRHPLNLTSFEATRTDISKEKPVVNSLEQQVTKELSTKLTTEVPIECFKEGSAREPKEMSRPHETEDGRRPSSASINSLPESFKSFIMNLNKNT